MPFLILVIIICMIVALFAVQNAVAVSLNFVFWSFSASLVLVILGAFLMGVLVATCFLLTMKAKHYLKDKKMREEIQQLQAENKRLQERVAMLREACKNIPNVEIDSFNGLTVSFDDILAVFHQFSDKVHCEKLEGNEEFDYLVYFEDGTPDSYRYCIKLDDDGDAVYHRFTPEDYAAFGF